MITERRAKDLAAKDFNSARGRSIDLVLTLLSGMLVLGAACALIVPFVSTTASLSQWVH